MEYGGSGQKSYGGDIEAQGKGGDVEYNAGNIHSSKGTGLNEKLVGWDAFHATNKRLRWKIYIVVFFVLVLSILCIAHRLFNEY